MESALNNPARDDSRRRLVELMRRGNLAYAAGNIKRAHHVWRRAAMLYPGEEDVWVVLLNALEDPEDRRVCLENILVINPNNEQARRQLDSLNKTPGEIPLVPDQTPAKTTRRRWSNRTRVLIDLLLLLAIAIIVVLLVQGVVPTIG